MNRIEKLGNMGVEAHKAHAGAVEAAAIAEAMAQDVMREILAGLLAGEDLQELVRAACVFPDSDGDLTYRERKQIADSLAAVPGVLIYPASAIEPGDRPGQAWTADEGDGIKPDTPAPLDQPIQSSEEIAAADLDESPTMEMYVIRGIDSQPPFWYADPAGEDVTVDINRATRWETEEEANNARSDGYVVEAIQVNLG